MPLSTQLYKWVPANSMLGVSLRWTSILSRGSRNIPKLRPDEPLGFSMSFHFFSPEIKLTDYEKEQLENWEFQGAEYFIHMKRAEEKNTMERRVCTLGDKYVYTCSK